MSAKNRAYSDVVKMLNYKSTYTKGQALFNVCQKLVASGKGIAMPEGGRAFWVSCFGVWYTTKNDVEHTFLTYLYDSEGRLANNRYAQDMAPSVWQYRAIIDALYQARKELNLWA